MIRSIECEHKAGAQSGGASSGASERPHSAPGGSLALQRAGAPLRLRRASPGRGDVGARRLLTRSGPGTGTPPGQVGERPLTFSNRQPPRRGLQRRSVPRVPARTTGRGRERCLWRLIVLSLADHARSRDAHEAPMSGNGLIVWPADAMERGQPRAWVISKFPDRVLLQR